MHFGKTSAGTLQPMLSQIATVAEALVIAGDLTDYGHPEEARALVKDLTTTARIPIVAVLGNHDFESGAEQEIRQILVDAGVQVLDGDSCEVNGIGFAGVKGFAGGFGRGVLGPWGEQVTKMFVHEAVNETLKLESALARLRTERKVVLLHYAPIEGTVEGEPREIYPYLGCGRLEEPLGRYGVTAVVHGHAHKGSLDGHTSTNIPVYNVALPLMRRTSPDQPFRIIDI
ncbi:MAG: metallophosphoesterase [Acidobacteria bacterium]|nr:MAG: metallophosphoesterase [Acidobacteriota bacterium]